MSHPIDWREARKLVYAAGRSAQLPKVVVPLSEADGRVLAEPLRSRTHLPAFPTSSIDGWAVRAAGPWRIAGRVLAGQEAPALNEDGTAMEIATGAMVPAGTTAILRVEESTERDGLVSGEPRSTKEWREPGEEAQAQEELFAAGTPVTPGLIGLAAACGLDELSVTRQPRAALLVFGDELLTEGQAGAGRIRDALGPVMPSYLERLGAQCVHRVGPIEDTLDAHVSAIEEALEADLICTTGGTMHGPVDHLHPALARLGAKYVVNTVAVRPGFPMLVAAITRGERTVFLAGLPGNPQSAVVALVSLVVPLLAGMTGADEPTPHPITLAAPVPGRGDYTHLALVRRQHDSWFPAVHVGSSMLRGLAGASGFAVIPPHSQGLPDHQVDYLELP
ncbi:molybdopterin molybdenumtransferase MoeA [Rhizocola hellebori]|uniref:Molybdopterin molybdenumtransferase n=1 Tax=Rhizocola hellebori TaxID=1392758 RepID=A0A8J3QG89_9ACTN|nr:molybdopterin molybdotransferase MoeA [Rhizocola hellebori]GIH08933.1 molybdopterin molybdenumtransferase MoeA [Rhizocola hellebori]